MHLSRPPKASLRPFVEVIWATDREVAAEATGGARELVLPTGALHLVLRLDDLPLRTFVSLDDPTGEAIGCAVIGGARAAPYLRDVSRPVPSVGALLRPGAGPLLLGAPAGVFSHAHTPLEEAWGVSAVAEARERLAEESSLAGRLALFETLLAARLPEVRGIDPRVAQALAHLQAGGQVGAAVRESGYSHRHFARVFTAAVGLSPKTYARLRRFGRALDRLTEDPAIAWAELAVAEGYADQAHFSREFRAFAGLSPGRYRRAAPAQPRHVAV